jgi:multidrug resistance efflux pump
VTKAFQIFFVDADAYDTIKQSIQGALGVIKKNKLTTEQARADLNERQIEEENAKISIEEEEAKIEKDETEKTSTFKFKQSSAEKLSKHYCSASKHGQMRSEQHYFPSVIQVLFHSARLSNTQMLQRK